MEEKILLDVVKNEVWDGIRIGWCEYRMIKMGTKELIECMVRLCNSCIC